MKNPKTKTKSPKSAGSKVNMSADMVGGLNTPWKEMGGLPTVEQLALMTATLARTWNENPDRLAEKAMSLWLAARKQIFLTNFGDSIGMQNRQWDWDKGDASSCVFEDPFASTFLPTDEYPVTRDQFLQRMLAKSKKNRTYDLAKIAKAFVRDTLRKRHGKDPTQDEISDAYGRWRPYENADQASTSAHFFKQWYNGVYLPGVRRDAGKKSAEKRAEAKAEKEKLAAKKESQNAEAGATEKFPLKK